MIYIIITNEEECNFKTVFEDCVVGNVIFKKNTHGYLLECDLSEIEIHKIAEKFDGNMCIISQSNDSISNFSSHILRINYRVNVYLMCGIPGSGKSTYISSFLRDLPVVSRDIIRAELGYTESVDDKARCNYKQEAKVTKIEHEKVKRYIDSCTDFIIDDTNVNPKYRKQMLKLLNDTNVNVIGINVKTSLENSIRRRSGQIPENVIREIYFKAVYLSENDVNILINYNN